jgi:hypothetical protein
MCSKASTSKEHAPPRCIFPERKDTQNESDLRKNLITVPSCDEHNSEKSRDDEYFLLVLAGSYTSSQVGLDQFITKVRRAFENQPSKANQFVRRSAPVRLRRVDTEWEDGLQVIVQGDRIDAVLSNCARTIYFHETMKKFQGQALVFTQFTLYDDEESQAKISNAFELTEKTLNSEPRRGENAEVFWYKFVETNSTCIFLMCFYDQTKAMVRFKKILVAQ